MWPHRRAFTLIDTLVAIGLMMLTTTLMTTFFVYALRQNQRNGQRQELVLQAEKAVLRVLSQFAPSRPVQLLYNTSISGIVFARASQQNSDKLLFDSQGILLWSSWQAYGWDPTSFQLWEASQAFVLPTTSGGELNAGPPTLPSSWGRRTLARRVREFQVTGPVGGVIRVRVLLQDDSGYQVEVVSSGMGVN